MRCSPALCELDLERPRLALAGRKLFDRLGRPRLAVLFKLDGDRSALDRCHNCGPYFHHQVHAGRPRAGSGLSDVMARLGRC